MNGSKSTNKTQQNLDTEHILDMMVITPTKITVSIQRMKSMPHTKHMKNMRNIQSMKVIPGIQNTKVMERM